MPGTPRGETPAVSRDFQQILGSQSLRFDRHPRSLGGTKYAYAVLSRRARGVSIGLNLNPDKICNFDCVYCQVDRTVPPAVRKVDEDLLLEELEGMVSLAATGELEKLTRHVDGIPAAYRRIADVAFSGDGEPTSYPGWSGLVDKVGDLIQRSLPGVPMTLITNASLFHRPRVREGLERLAARGGHVWAKLDAGTEDFYARVAVTSIPFERILENIGEEARRHPLVIQSLFFRFGSQAPPAREIAAFAERLADLVAGGGHLRAVQLTTIARKPPRPDVKALGVDELGAIERVVRGAIPGVPVEVYPAAGEFGPADDAGGDAEGEDER